MEVNRHHILHYKDYWRANKENDKLRRKQGLIAPLEIQVHTELHRECPAPPPLDPFTAQRVNRLYTPHPHPLQGIDNLRFAVEQAIRSPNIRDVERQIGMLTIEAVTLQLPYIRDGLVSDD